MIVGADRQYRCLADGTETGGIALGGCTLGGTSLGTPIATPDGTERTRFGTFSDTVRGTGAGTIGTPAATLEPHFAGAGGLIVGPERRYRCLADGTENRRHCTHRLHRPGTSTGTTSTTPDAATVSTCRKRSGLAFAVASVSMSFLGKLFGEKPHLGGAEDVDVARCTVGEAAN